MALSLQDPHLLVPTNHDHADQFYRRLIVWFNNFHKSLDEEHEAGARLVSFGQSVTFHVEDISWWNPSLISFQGKTESGDRVELIQHVTQISVLLVALRRPDPTIAKRPIGFGSWEEYEKAKE